MRTNLISDSITNVFNRSNQPRHLETYRRLREQVLSQYGEELDQVGGWKRYWMKWKLDLIVEIRYRQLLFSKQ
jgi:hypothetical protein